MTDRIDPETLAALLDGTLTGAERERALASIARSPESYEEFVEASALVREIAQPRRRFVRWWMPTLAAAAGLAAVVFALSNNRSDDPLLLASGLDVGVGSGSLSAALGPDWRSLDWPVTRGTETGPTTAAVIRTGTRWVDLHAAVTEGDSAAMRETAFDLEVLLPAEFAAQIRALTPESTETLRRLGPQIRGATQDDAVFDAAMWLEHTRLRGLARTAGTGGDPWKLDVLDDIIARLATGDEARRTLATELRQVHTGWSQAAPAFGAAATVASRILRRAGG